MKIVRVHATPVNGRAQHSGDGLLREKVGFSRSIVEVVTDAGITGWGEAPSGEAAQVINRYFAPLLVGLDPNEWQTARLRCLPHCRGGGANGDVRDRMAYAGVNLALWDIMGKAAGKPLFRLLGGPVREKAPFSAYADSIDADADLTEAQVPLKMADMARRLIEETGAKVLEFNVGRNALACEVETVHAIRETLGGAIDLSLVANMPYSIGDARRLLADVAGAGIQNFGNPVASLAEMQRLRSEFDVPVSTCCTNFEVLQNFPLIDSVVADVHCEGGIAETLSLGAVASSHHRRFSLQASYEFGVSWAARCHLGIACPDAARPARALFNRVVDDLVLGDPWHVRDGGYRPPEIPGLGVEIDPDALACAAEDYGKNGEHGYIRS